jgi:hypothetical protein
MNIAELLAAKYEMPFPEGWKMIKHYAWGSFSKGWNGAWAAVYGYIGTAVGSAIDPATIDPPSLHLIVYCFGVAWCVAVIGYFKDHPLQEHLPSTPAPFPPASK